MNGRLVVGGIAASCALVAAACGGSSSSTPSASGGGTPQQGGNLVIARSADSQSMNNTNVFDNESIWVFEQIFQTLYTVSPDGKGVLPELATSYTVSPDKLTYTFALRPGVKFSTGAPMTSKDVQFSIEQAMKASSGWGYIDSAIKDVQAPDPGTVVVDLSHPWAPLLSDLSLFANGVVPYNYGGETEDAFYNHPVGTGPFKWDVWDKGKSLELVKNTYYWQKGLPHLDSVTWTDVSDSNTRQLQLEGKQAQIDEFPAWSSVAALKRQPGINMDLFNSTRTDYFEFNEQRKPFQDPKVRQAISLAINRKALISAVLFGNGTPANSFMPPQLEYYDRSAGGYQYDLAAAKADMAASSVPGGFTTTILIPAGEADNLSVAQILQSELKAIGITLNITQLDANTVNTNQQNLDYDTTLTYWTMDIPDPDELVTFAVDPTAGSKSFFTAYDNPAVVSEASQAEATYDPAQRAALYAKIQQQSAADAFMAFLYYSPYAYATSSTVHGFVVTPLGNYHLEDTWMSKA